ncbi:MAG: hypothetical protein HY721_12285 [Planctomycetes bacterium]|nr:hypothetical protein [Planctomycetota bacterium]
MKPSRAASLPRSTGQIQDGPVDQSWEQVQACGVTFVPQDVQVPALRKMVVELARGSEAALVSCRHRDWSQQAQCGCVAGCLGG